MKAPRQLIIISLGLFSLILGTEQARSRSHGALEAPVITKTLYRFTSKLFETLNNGSKNEPDNIIVSPMSIQKALNLVLLGTDSDTKTEREFRRTLGYTSETDAHECHKEYAKVLAKFKHLTNEAMAQAKREQGQSESKQQPAELRSKAPLLDLFNMVITKNEAEVLPKYREKIVKYYNSSVVNVDDDEPESKKRIMDKLNRWGKEAGFNEPIMKEKELDREFDVILLSAIHIQGFWSQPMHESKGKASFYNHGLKDKPVDAATLVIDAARGLRYLELTDVKRAQFKERAEKLARASPDTFRLLSRLNAQIVSVPLDGDLTYTIFEPLEHSTPNNSKLNELVELLFTGRYMRWAVELLDGEHGRVRTMDLTMPKFKFEKELEINEVLKSMGIKRAFEDKDSEISSLTSEKHLVIDKATHQAVIEVNEKGIKAAGVTKLAVLLSVPKPFPVSITKPFVFLIRYGKIPLFVGQLSSL